MDNENTTDAADAQERPETGESGGEDKAGLENALRRLRDENKSLKDAQSKRDAEDEKKRQAALSEAEKAVEAARKEGYEKAMGESRLATTQAKIVAAAAAAGFADPKDAPGLLGSLDDLDSDEKVTEAVNGLAEKKRYLLRGSNDRQMEQGQRSKDKSNQPDWLRNVLADR